MKMSIKCFLSEKSIHGVIRTWYVLQQDEDHDEDPKMYREIYTQHWDPDRFRHFHDQPVE